MKLKPCPRCGKWTDAKTSTCPGCLTVPPVDPEKFRKAIQRADPVPDDERFGG